MLAAFIRHGDYHQLSDTPSAHQPYPLTSAGEEQAREGADWLAAAIERNGWVLHPCVDSSRMLRAWQTAWIISRRFGIDDIQSFDDLAERGLGCAANLTTMEIERILRLDPRFTEPPSGWKANSHYRLPLQGAESLLDAGQRVANHCVARMQALGAQGLSPNTLKLFVGHGAAFRHAAHHLGVLAFEQLAKLSMYHARPVVLEYDPQGGWRHLDGEWKLRSVTSRFTD